MAKTFIIVLVCVCLIVFTDGTEEQKLLVIGDLEILQDSRIKRKIFHFVIHCLPKVKVQPVLMFSCFAHYS